MQLCLFSRFACFHMFKTYGSSLFMFPFLRFGFLSLCTGTFLKAYLSLSSHFPEAEEHLKLRLCKYCLKSFLRAFLSPLRNTFRALNRFDLLPRLF